MPHTDTLAETMDFWLQVYDKPGSLMNVGAKTKHDGAFTHLVQVYVVFERSVSVRARSARILFISFLMLP